ncbi:MAG: hypothetical protein PHI73_00480 [Patescibacteria group bacterium]|nr:hypothetical protein [Patescibacteria group bacterium]
MIDTIILSIPKTKTIKLDFMDDSLKPWDLQSRTNVYDKYVKNAPSKEIGQGTYYPRLTGFRRKGENGEWGSTIKIEFSAPKLLFQNNLDELTEDQFDNVVDVLRERMKKMGVGALTGIIADAKVMAVHYSKNIELTNGYTAEYVIGELNKVNLNKRFDLARARYMNDGQSLYAYTTAHSLVIYDKIADLTRGKKRSTDREQSDYQLSLLEALVSQKKQREILRIEVRLSQKQKINTLFEKLGYTKNPSFKDVFSEEKSKAVLQHYWDTMIDGNISFLFTPSLSAKDVLKQVLFMQPDIKPKEAIYRTGLVLASREGNGMRELRAMLKKRSNDRTWFRMAADARATGLALSEIQPREWCSQIKGILRDYRPFRVKNS